MRIGILGGTFDPIHIGHLALADEARRRLKLDLVLLIPTGDPPYKRTHSGRGDRLNMAYLAAREAPGIEVCDWELFRPGKTYAVDTVRKLRAEYPGAELFYLLGADAYARVGKWKGAQELDGMCRFVCAGRTGAGEDWGLPEVSSEEIRREILEGKMDKTKMPASVARYVSERGLYLSPFSEEEILACLRGSVKPSRFTHILGVRDTAASLARRHGADVGMARCAGLLHDCAKGMTDEELLALADDAGADETEKRCLPVLHAPVGALLAKTRYQVRSPEVLRAIRRHTIGAEDMSILDAVVYVADMIEPGRSPFPGLERARLMAEADLFGAARLCALLTVDYARRRGGTVHPMTEKMLKQQGG